MTGPTYVLDRRPALATPTLLAPPTAAAIAALPGDVAERIFVSPIDPDLADTAQFCAAYGTDPGSGANCLIVEGRRGDVTRYAACLVLATTRADINHVVRHMLDVRRAGFAAMADAVAQTRMQPGGITPIGLPDQWRVLVDVRVRDVPDVVIGAGIRGAKLFLPGSVLCALPRVEVVEGLGIAVV